MAGSRTLASLLCILLAACFAPAEEPAPPGADGRKWKPPVLPDTELHARVPFLQPGRDWERLDVWVPKPAPEKKMPCLVAIYGGGYGGKGLPVKDVAPLLKKGWVIAAPDYMLGPQSPVPMCSWDIATGVRYLRANAEKFSVDPERIGAIGWSAGGWIAQDLFYEGPRRLVNGGGKDRRNDWVPFLDPHPKICPEQSYRIQGVVSDWGCGKLWQRGKTEGPVPWLTADDPPLFTIYNGPVPQGKAVNPVMALQELGVSAHAVYGYVGGTHVPPFAGKVVDEANQPTTWGDGIFRFLDEQVKNAKRATAPEMRPCGGPIPGPTAIELLTVHPAGAIHYTLDGSAPTAASPKCAGPVTVQPGQTLKVIAIRPGLKDSAITAATFVKGPPEPRILNVQAQYDAEVGKPFRLELKAENAADAAWVIAGVIGEHYRNWEGKSYNPPRLFPWLSIDANGVLSGTPRAAYACPVTVFCMKYGKQSQGPQPPSAWAADAKSFVIAIKPAAKP